MTLPTMRKTNLGDRSKQGTATTTTSKTLPRQEKLNDKSSRNGATNDKKNDLKKDLDRKDLDRKYLNSSKVGKKENIINNNNPTRQERFESGTNPEADQERVQVGDQHDEEVLQRAEPFQNPAKKREQLQREQKPSKEAN